MITYKIEYRDTMSNGEWCSTTYTASKSTTRRDVIKFFGLDREDVLEYKISIVE